MTQPTGNIRKLSFPLSFTEDMESIVGVEPIEIIDLSDWATTDPDERVDIILNLSLNEYIALANTIDVGRDIAYGENSIYIWWVWVRSLQAMTICDAVTACILTNIDTQNAIQAIGGGDPFINGNPIKWETLAIEPVAGCDDDRTWGYAKALWDFINQQNVDFLEILDEATNTGEQIARMMSSIPLFALLPFDEIVDWLASLGEYNLDAYNASITVEINEQIWCDLFCLAKDNNCSLTFEQVWDYFLEEFGGVNFPTLGATFAELVIYMVTGSYLSDRIVYLWTLVQLGVMFIGGEFLGTNTMNEIAIHAQNGDPDNDWETLCDECGWTYTSDFPTDEDGWIPYQGAVPFDYLQAIYANPIWDNTEGARNASFFQRSSTIVINIADTHVDTIELDYTIVKGAYYDTSLTQIAIICELVAGGNTTMTQAYTSTTNGSHTMVFNVDDDIKSIRCVVRPSIMALLASLTGSSEVTEIRASGIGTNPF